jgi:hypothetical protein
MYTNNKHICIFICYNNFEHIVKCFESIKNLPIDFFIIENFSKNSKQIEDYFIKQKVKGYVQFEKNITNNAVNIIKKDFSNLFESYEYITFSDCDLLVVNPQSLFDEIYKILNHDDVGVCCSSLSMDNLPNVPDAQSWIPQPISHHKDYINTNTGVHFMTIKQKNYKIIKNTKFLDSLMCSEIRSRDLKWVATKKNNVKHLTWDLYHVDDEYYGFKLKRGFDLWSHNEVSNYVVL